MMVLMKRNQWILVGTAGALSVGIVSLGAMSVATAMDVRDASGAPVAEGEIRGLAASTDALAAEKGVVQSIIVAPTPTSPAAPSPTSAPAGPSAAEPAPAPSAPPPPAQEPEPVPAPAPVPPADSAPSASAASAASAASND